jgi:hypothetical protein
LRIVKETGDVEEMAGVIDGMARVAAVSSPERAAARFCGMADALGVTKGTARPPAEQAPHERAVPAIRRALSLQQAIAEAIAVADDKR